MNIFSAFKLLYEEFIYKKNIMVDYNLVNDQLNNIKDMLFELNDLNKDDKELYLKKLEKYNKKIRKELDTIMDIYPYFFELYFVLYKRFVNSFDEFKDMPLVISCSFYNDFQLDKKSYISRYSSKEKREYRNDAKRLGYVNFFIKVLKNRNKSYLSLLIDELIEFTNKEVIVKYSFQTVKNSFASIYKSIDNQLSICIKEAKKCEDYNIITDIMDIAFKDKIETIAQFNTKLDEYLLIKYENTLHSSNNILNNLSYNYISYKEYKKMVKEEKRNKHKYDEEFRINGCINYEESLYLNDFRKIIINNYYDIRRLDDKQFKSLANEVPEWLFSYKKFKSMYSSNFNRDNNLRYALLNNIYELYNPQDILNTLGDKYLNSINKSLKVMCRDFFLNNYRDNVSSKTEEYDTRDYDLSIILDIFNTKELVDIYKEVEATNDDENSVVLLISKCIAKSLGNENPTEDNIYDIASKYLDVRLGVSSTDIVTNLEQYNILYESYLVHCSFDALKRGL